MIPVPNPISEPANFATDCRKKGEKWIGKNPESKNYPAYWREFQSPLAEAFGHRCGWSVMWIDMDGAVDHFYSQSNRPDLIYRWENYRYVSTTINSSKQDLDDLVLDPFEVGNAWFEIRLPSLILVMTDKVPEMDRPKAKFTLCRLKLRNGSKFVESRKNWYSEYRNKGLPMDHLKRFAPLVADAIERWETTGRELPQI